uniref:Uncharacterized protein n=1 Tax=Cacopsylla melanoneura TaxID=428564 RepID=A0A8D9F2R9_9HEMI
MIIWPQEMHKQRHRVFIRRIINWFLMFFLSEGNVLARILSRNTTDINIHHHLSALIGLLMFFYQKEMYLLEFYIEKYDISTSANHKVIFIRSFAQSVNRYYRVDR